MHLALEYSSCMLRVLAVKCSSELTRCGDVDIRGCVTRAVSFAYGIIRALSVSLHKMTFALVLATTVFITAMKVQSLVSAFLPASRLWAVEKTKKNGFVFSTLYVSNLVTPSVYRNDS